MTTGVVGVTTAGVAAGAGVLKVGAAVGAVADAGFFLQERMIVVLPCLRITLVTAL